MNSCLPAAVLFFLLPTAVMAHDHWINNNGLQDPQSKQLCCNANDCFASKIDGVREVIGGFFVSRTGEIIPHNRVLWKSPDGAWWECLWHVNGQARIRCLIGPPPGS